MSNNATQIPNPHSGFEMVPLSDAMSEVKISPATLRRRAEEGEIRLYKYGKCLFFSKSELASAIKAKPGPKRSRKMAAVRQQRSRKEAAV